VQLIEELLLRRKGCDNNISNDIEEWSEGGKKSGKPKERRNAIFN
jgi:hypothetical protein